MAKQPQLKLIFILTKNDCTDFNRDAVTRHLEILPSKESAPVISKGSLICDTDVCEIEKALFGITVPPAPSGPYQMIKHAYWSVELPKKECWELKELLNQMEQIFAKKEAEVINLCKEHNLSANLISRIYAKSNSMPNLSIPSDSISFWASMGVTISFDFYLD